MVQVTELSYMGIGVKNLDEWKNFAARIIGMELAEDEERDRCYLRMDYWHHRIVLHADDLDDLMYLGFRVAGPGGIPRDATAVVVRWHTIPRGDG